MRVSRDPQQIIKHTTSTPASTSTQKTQTRHAKQDLRGEAMIITKTEEKQNKKKRLLRSLSRVFFTLLSVDTSDDFINLFILQKIKSRLSSHHSNIHILAPALYSFHQCTNCQFHSALISQFLFFVFLFQKLSDCFAILSCGICFPFRKSSRGICLVKLWGTISLSIKTSNQSGDTERTNTTTLSIFLLDLRDVTRHVLDCGSILQIQTITLCFNSCLLD
mmetsp:Transcript_35693/g.48808  ORF Transcript_35693/g.48808 Transcript_35693/m.48808 type:complete len:220 (+) Transcript_35693:60-719(+)